MPERISIQARLDRDFKYHAPDDEKKAKHEHVRTAARDLANVIVAWTPESREQSIALTHLEEAMFWANAAIARA